MTRQWLGLCPYQKALALQTAAQDNIIFGCEHPAVITLGRRAQPEQDVIQATVPVVRTDRGGLATLHSPGQLVIYPVLSLREIGWGVREYVERLLATTQTWLQECQIKSFYDLKNPGLYTDKGKIAFVGLRVERGRTRHGLSINVRNDLKLFSSIHPCGQKQQNFDRLGGSLSLEAHFERWVELFQI